MTQHPTRLSVLRTLDQAPGTPHEAWAVFADEADLLRFAQQHWRHVLDAAIDDALETGGGTLRDDVRAAYAGAASRHPGLRRLLDGHATHPAIAALVRREHAMVARAAGVGHSSEVIAPVAAAGAGTVPRPRGWFRRRSVPAVGMA
ncbi:MAG TPA: hypothetical protein VF728_06340 [Nocardioides sp.]